MNIILPSAGAGSRFARAGYKLPKPMIDVMGKPMIQVATEYLNFPDARFIFIVQKNHNEQYGLEQFLKTIKPGCEVVEVSGLTEGAACTVLAARHLIDDDQDLIIANCDQYVEFDCAGFMQEIISCDAVGGMVTFKAQDRDPKWSYAKLDDAGYICEVAEKKAISDIATSGIYHFRTGKSFLEAADAMIKKNIRVNNEFYICPIYNEIVNRGKIINKFCTSMHGLGTPEDLAFFIKTKGIV